MTLADRWMAVWTGLGLAIPDGAAWTDLAARYREPHRAYHTEQHLRECLDWFDRLEDAARMPYALELAIWYHDAVYWPRRDDNEAASAALASMHLAAGGGSAGLAAHVTDLILWTRHRAPPPPGDAALLVEIDLAILGAPRPRYAEYERQIRQEYAWVPAAPFRRRRAALLQAFLDRPRLYSTPLLFDRLERQARDNLATTLRNLRRP